MKYLPLLLISLIVPSLFAISASDVEEVRLRMEGSRSGLQPADRSLIEEFWENSLNRMLLSDDILEIVEIRKQLEDQKGSQPLSFFASAYVSVAKQDLQTAFENIGRMGDAPKQQLLDQNLMILTAELKSPALVSIALGRIDDTDPVVRYWAVKALTNSGIIQSLGSEVTADEEIKAEILSALKQHLETEQQFEIYMMTIKFAAAMDHPIAHEILLTIADKRIAAYMNWSVENEMMDAKLLIALGNVAMMTPEAGVKSMFARKFAEYYSLVFQRYFIGKEVLSDAQIEQVVAVILEVDEMVLPKMLNIPTTGILKAIQRNIGLEREYENIFGDRIRLGELETLYKFDYGKDDSGKAITEPPKLPEPPAPKISEENTEEETEEL